MLISFERTGKNQLKPGEESMGYAPVLSHCSLLEILDQKATSVLEHRRERETNC